MYKWVYRTEYTYDESVKIFKVRRVARGFSQFEGIYYNKTFPLSPKWNPSISFYVLSLHINGRSIKWMSNPPSFMGICRNKFTWNNRLPMITMTLFFFFILKKLSMALSKLLELCMPNRIAFSLTLAFLDAILTPMSTKKVKNHLTILVFNVDNLFLTSSDHNLLIHVKSILKKKLRRNLKW